MEWKEELRALTTREAGRKNNSPLKKKLSIIKRLRNIPCENIEALRTDLASEDMGRFASEIVSSILGSKVQSNEDVKNVVRITSALATDGDFLRSLVSELWRTMCGGIHSAGEYWLAAYLFDLQTMVQEIRGGVGRTNVVEELCSKLGKEPRILFLAYLVENHGDERSEVEIRRQVEKIGAVETGGDSRLAPAMRRLGMDVGQRKCNGFRRIISTHKDEFQYYTERTTSSESYDGELDMKQIRGYMIRYSENIEKLDALSKSIRNSNNQKEIVSIMMQLKSNMNYITSIARVLKSAGIISKKMVSLLFKEIYENKHSSRNDVIANCLLISEMCKFREVPPGDVFVLLDHLFRARNIEAYCTCLSGVGRYFLLDEATGYKTREYIEKIKEYRASDVESTHVASCLTKLFSFVQAAPTDFRGFFRYFFRREAFSRSSKLWNSLVRNKATLLFLFLHPWDFEDTEFLVTLIQEAGLGRKTADAIISNIHTVHEHSKHRCTALVKLYAGLADLEDKETQINLTDKIFLLEMDGTSRHRLAIMYLQRMSIDIRRRYVPVVKSFVDRSGSVELGILLFNLCEGCGIEVLDSGCDDSFDEELNFMRYI